MLRRSLFFICLLVFCLTSILRADTFTEQSHHFSFNMPSSWRPMSSGELSDVRTWLNFDFVAGGKNSDGSSYFLVQSFIRPSGTPTNYLKSYRSAMEKAGVDVVSITIDNDHAGYIAETRIPTRYGKAPALTYAFFGTEEVITFHCFAPKSSFNDSRESYQALASSFAFDSGYGYSPYSLTNIRTTTIVGIIISAILFFFRRSIRGTRRA
jgi:hypothetical protein